MLTEKEIEVIVGVIKLILNLEDISQKQGLPKVLYDNEIITLNTLSSKLSDSLVEEQFMKLWDGKEKLEA